MGLQCVLHINLLGDTHVGDLVCIGSTCANVDIPLGVEVRLGKLSLLVLRVSLTANQGMRQSCLILMWTCGCMP